MTPGEEARGLWLEAERLLTEVVGHPRWREATVRRPMLVARLAAARREVARLAGELASARPVPEDALERARTVRDALERLLAEVEAGGDV